MITKKNKKKPSKSYLEVIQDEVLQELGQKILFHRQIHSMLMANSGEKIKELEASEVVEHMDDLYQSSFDGILDSLSNCLDMNLANESLRAIRTTMDIRRGMVKRQKT